MKRTLILLPLMFIQFLAFSQLQPVTWTFSAKKTSDLTYEVEWKATIQEGWHLFSQTQPADAVASPTAFTFNPNPLIVKSGSLREVGVLEKHTDKTLGVTSHQYAGQVSFLQTISLKAKVKTSLAGSVEYQTCDEERCLPPQKLSFSIPIQ